jgi:hypothetical protein
MKSTDACSGGAYQDAESLQRSLGMDRETALAVVHDVYFEEPNDAD